MSHDLQVEIEHRDDLEGREEKKVDEEVRRRMLRLERRKMKKEVRRKSCMKKSGREFESKGNLSINMLHRYLFHTSSEEEIARKVS